MTKKSWHEAALRQGRVSLITKNFQQKMFVPLHFFQAREGRVFKIQENLCGVLSQIARRLRCSDKRRHANIRRKPEAQHCSSLCSQSEGDEYRGGQTRLKIQRRYALKRWLYSLHVRGPHFASKVSYNAGAATDDYAGQCKTPLRGRCRLFSNLELSGFLTPYL